MSRWTKIQKFLIVILAVTIGHVAYGQLSQLETGINKIIENKELKLGLALYDFSNGDTLSINGNARFPMQSVFKFPIALAMLHEVDKNKFELNQPIFIKKEDLSPNLWSPIREKYPQGNIYLPLSEIIKYTVSQSDNSGCDLLLKMLNGPSSVNNYIHSKGIMDIRIQNNEQEIQSDWSIQFNNWVTPLAMIEILKQFHNKELLLPPTHSFLWTTMSETSTGSIRAKLPPDTIVAHKTGWSGYNKEQVLAAKNDVGVMVLPNGKKVGFAIFITNSKESEDITANIISDIARLVYDFEK